MAIAWIVVARMFTFVAHTFKNYFLNGLLYPNNAVYFVQ